MIRPRWIIFILPLIGVALQARAAATHSLQNISRIDEFDQSRIVFDFSDLPEFRIETSGQRVDLLLDNTDVASSLSQLPEDDKIVKVLLARKPAELLVSILLHKIPDRVVAEKSPVSRQITLNISWEPSGARRPAIAFQLSGMPTAHHAIEGVATPQTRSLYSGRWEEFFKSPHTPIEIPVPLRPTMPNLPAWPPGTQGSAQSSLLDLANTGKWQALLKKLKENAAEPAPDLATLLHAEALLRTGQANQALELLDQWQPDFKPSPEGDRAIYLRALAQAALGQPYQARCSLAPLLTRSWPSAALDPFIRLLEAELLLAVDQTEQARVLLDRPLRDWPKTLQRPLLWRRAEALALAGKSEAAERLFRNLFSRKGDPLADYSDILYQAGRACLAAGRFRQAEAHFRALRRHLHDAVDQGKALFLAARAAYLTKDLKRALVSLEQLRDNFEGTEPGYRAWMALLDHRFVHGEHAVFSQIAADYASIAGQAPIRPLREEASFKQILTCYLHSQPERAAHLLETFLRNFSHGPLRNEARALLSEILPPLVREQIRNGQDMKAVVLVERNRELLINGNLAWPFLPDLARAYTRLGLWDKACKTYFFLIDREADRKQEQDYYLPLVELLYDQGRYAMASSFAQRYLDKFPTGKDRQKLFLVQLQALAHSNRLDEAAALLDRRDRPRGDDISLQSARIFRQRGESARIIELPDGLNDAPEGMLLRAEALFEAKRNREALELYEQLLTHDEYGEQALFRCGQIRLKNGDRQAAVKLFGQLADKKPTSMWGRLAKDVIAARNLN